MLFTELFNGKDNCAVCGQTPCNCTHVTEEKVRLDPKCWKGKKIGNPKTKMKGGVRVNNCVPAESVAEGINDGRVDSPVSQAITRRIIHQRPDLLKYGPAAVMAAVDEVADFVGDVEEIGSSDVSAWVQQVARHLQTQAGEGLAENYEDEECHVCNGTGEGRTEHENCSHCGGSGMEPSDKDDDDYEMYDTDDDYDRGGDDESHYEKYVRTRGLEETKPEEKIGGRYDPDDFDAMVLRLKKLAGAGPMKTVYDPEKRVYKNVPQSSEKK